MKPILDPNTDNRWSVKENREVPGAVDLLCVVGSPHGNMLGDRRYKLECVPVSILEQLLKQAKTLPKEEKT